MPDISALAFAIVGVVSFLGSAVTAAFSIGGGLMLIAVVSWLLPPAAVIPVHGVIMLGSNAGRSVLLMRHVDWNIIGWFSAGAAVGGLLGAQIVFGLDQRVLRLAIAGFILFTQWGPKIALPLGAKFYAIAGSLSMFITLFVGASGPFMTSILARIEHFSRMALIATAGACMTIQHGGKVAIFGFGGFDFGPWLPLMISALVAGALGTFLGTRILKHIDEALFRKVLRYLLSGLAGWLVILAFSE